MTEIPAGKKKRKHNRLIVFLYIIMAGLYLTDVLYMWINGINLLNSDSAAELILAKKLSLEGGLLSRTWYYSTELRVLNTQIIYKIGFFFFPDNWHAARVLSVALFLIIMILVAHYFALTIRYPLAAPLLSIILLAPYSNWYGWNVVFNSYYVPHICIALTAVCLFVRTLKVQNRGHRIVCVVLSCALAFVGCLGGVRQLMICYAPLFLAVLLHAYDLHLQQRRDGQDRRRHILMTLCYVVLLCIVAYCGYKVNLYIRVRYYSFQTQEELTWGEFDLSTALYRLGQLISLFGWHEGAEILTSAGIGSVMSVVMAFLLAGCTIYCFRKVHLEESESLVLLYSVSCLAVLLIVYGFTEIYNVSYWTVYLPDAFIGMLLFTKYWKPRLERVGLILFIIATLLIDTRATMRSPYISWVPNDLEIQDAAAWLEENGYTQGVADFWNSDIVTALTNGKIEMWTVDDIDTMTTADWLQDKSHDELPKGKVFVIREVPDDQEDTDESLQKVLNELQQYRVYQDDSYLIYEFDDIQQYCDIVWGVYGEP